jgi:hypothetical protein
MDTWRWSGIRFPWIDGDPTENFDSFFQLLIFVNERILQVSLLYAVIEMDSLVALLEKHQKVATDLNLSTRTLCLRLWLKRKSK